MINQIDKNIMKKIFTLLLFGLSLAVLPVMAQDEEEIDESYVFVDANGAVIPNGSVVVRDVLEQSPSGEDMIASGIFVKNVSAPSTLFLRMHYEITQLDNGYYQLAFPISCNSWDTVGNYTTSEGLVDGTLDIQSEWFPADDGVCEVVLMIETVTRKSLFPPRYIHSGNGPTITVRFVKSSSANDGSSYVKLADGVYLDGKTLYICSGVTSLGDLQINPDVIYCYATIPPSLMSNTFTGYNAALHVPKTAMVSYFSALYWYNFNNIIADAVEPQSLTISNTSAEVEEGGSLSLTAAVIPSNATPNTVTWFSTNTAVATVNDGIVTAVAAGECDIIAMCVDKQAMCHVVVTPQRVNISLDQHEARLLPNHTMTLTATCVPATTELVVSTSDPAVAIPRFVNGTIMIVGVGEGTATIKVTTADGWANPDYCEVTVYTLMGDVNTDGFVDVDDVTVLIARVLGDESQALKLANADVNGDNYLDIEDVTYLINYILYGTWPEEPVTPPDTHEWVDLGLPSGTLWATCNVGANVPEEYGDYFAWGETEPKEVYEWSTYKWCNGSDTTLTKYCTNSIWGYQDFTDGKVELDPEDDAAYVNWGPSWRMPTVEQLNELIDNCSWTWTARNGVYGRLFTGPNGNTLFLPAAGHLGNNMLRSANSDGLYWTRSLGNTGAYYALALSFYSGGKQWWNIRRYCGLSVRAVRVP